MANFNLEISGKLKSTTKGNADWYYGGGNEAWADLASTKAGVPLAVRNGKTVGVLEANKIVEYIWHNDDLTDNGLVLKTASSSGAQVLNGTADPATGDGVDGDFWINTTNNTLFGPKAAGSWGTGISLIGPQGVQGAAGTQGAQGIQGIPGNDGAVGPQGAAGNNGADGKTVLNGTADPVTGDGIDGDFWINTTNNTLFGPKAAGSWGTGISLIGPQGPQGVQGAAGTQGAQGIQGIPGNDGAVGPQGVAGNNGADGKTVLNGTTDPVAGNGVNGDFWINTTNNTLFGPKTSGVWGTGISLIGPQGAAGLQGIQGTQGVVGAQGPAGADGKTMLTGIVAPTTEGVDGDFYYESVTPALYGPKTGGSWGSPKVLSTNETQYKVITVDANNNYTLVASDSGKTIYSANQGGPGAWTIPFGVFTPGTRIYFYVRVGGRTINFVGAANVNLTALGGSSVAQLNAYAVLEYLYYSGTNEIWTIMGQTS